MLNQLPMAINPSVNYNNNFHRIEMPNLGQHPFLDAFVIEANTKTISESIAIFLGIGYDECIQYIGINNFTHCQFPRDGFKGHYMRYKGISLDQLRTLVDIAKSKGAVKFIPTIAELILTQVLPLFNSQAQIKHDDFKKETLMSKVMPTENHSQKFHSDLFGDLTVLTHADGSLWFIGKEVAEKLGYKDTKDAISRHCKGAGKHRLLTGGGEQEVTIIPERDVYRLVMRSKLPTAEKFEDFVVSDILPSIRKTGGYGQSTPTLPTNYKEALLALVQKVDETERLTAENEHLNKTKMQISSKREATAMGKLARANDKIKQLEMVTKLETNLADKIEKVTHATILAIQSRVSNLKASGLKLGNYCRKHGLEIQNIPEPRFGVVHSYPAQAWRGVYNININSILGV